MNRCQIYFGDLKKYSKSKYFPYKFNPRNKRVFKQGFTCEKFVFYDKTKTHTVQKLKNL